MTVHPLYIRSPIPTLPHALPHGSVLGWQRKKKKPSHHHLLLREVPLAQAPVAAYPAATCPGAAPCGLEKERKGTQGGPHSIPQGQKQGPLLGLFLSAP